MQTLILIILLLLVAVLMVVGFKDEDSTKGNPRRGRLLIAAGFGLLALAGFTVYGFDGQGLFSIGICAILGMAYLTRGLQKGH
jgi:hypothetical protein